jgi:hypothetical protein
VPAYEAVKPALDGHASLLRVVNVTSITGVVDTNGSGSAAPLKIVGFVLDVQLMSKHEARESESWLVTRNSVKNSVTSWKPPSLPPPGARIHEHDSEP